MQTIPGRCLRRRPPASRAEGFLASHPSPTVARVTAGRDDGVALDPAAAFAAVGRLVGALRGAVCTVTTDGVGLQPRWAFGYSDEFLAGWTRFDLSGSAPLTDAARLGEVVTVRSREELSARYPGIVHHTFDDTAALLAVPLIDPDDGAVVATIGMSFADARHLDTALPGIAALTAGLTRHVMATDPGRVSRDGVSSRRDAEPQALRRLTHRLVATLTAEEVVDAVDAHAPAVVDAVFARVVTIDPVDGTQTLVTATSPAPEVDADYARIPADAPLPSTEAASTGQPVWLRSRAELLERFPALADFPVPLTGLAAVPLGPAGAPTGVLTFGWLKEVHLNAWEREAVLQVADLCAQALDRARSYSEQQRARAAAERSTARLQVLTTLAGELGGCTTPEDVGRVLATTARTALGADAATVVTAEGAGAFHVLAWVSDVGLDDIGITDAALPDLSLLQEQLTSREPVFVRSHLERDLRFPDMAGLQVRQQAWANLPLFAGDRIVGTAAFGWDDVRDFPPDEREFLVTLARHAAVALDRTHLMAASRTAAEVLQRALLPEVGSLDGVEAASRYVPAVIGSEVGGDWYDVFPLEGGRLGLTLGDVEGKGVAAAAVMGTVRNVLRAYATVTPDPDVVLHEVDDYLGAFGHHQMVTVWYAVLDPAAGLLFYSSAGHPPALLILEDAVTWLDEGGGPPLGILGDARRRTTRVTLPADRPWAVLMYSDGLVERRSAMLREGMADVARAAQVLVTAPDLDASLGDLVDAAAGHPDRTFDDVAALVVRGGRRQ